MDENVTDWLVVPVFYRTNRTKLPGKMVFGNDELNRDGRYFGIKNIVVPMPDHMPISKEKASQMGWQFIHLDKPLASGKKPQPPEKCLVPDRELSVTEVIAAISQSRKSSGQDRVVLFAHGCCATFDSSMERAGKIAAHMQVPLVLYDWVSPIGFTNYLKNETLVEQELDDFSRFLLNVDKLVPAKFITLIGHSMGAKFIDSAMVRRFERYRQKHPVDKYDEIVFSNPDIDARSYINHNAEVASNANRVYIYMSRADGRLRTSATAHGGFVRLGRPETLLPELCHIQNQDLIDVTSLGYGHEMPFWVVNDFFRDGKLDDKHGFTLQPSGEHLFVVK